MSFIPLTKIEKAIIDKLEPELSGVTVANITEKSQFNSDTGLYEIIAQAPFSLWYYDGRKPTEKEQSGESLIKKPIFKNVVGTKSLRSYQDARFEGYDLIEKINNTIDGKLIQMTEGNIILELEDESGAFLIKNGTICYELTYSYIANPI